MALIPCPECSREVSSVALACPQCAFPYPGRKDKGNGHYEGALRTCPDCNRIVSRQVQMCPHCGAPAPMGEETPESLSIEEGEETWMCPNCGVPFTRRQKVKKLAEDFNSLLSNEEKGIRPQSKPIPENEEGSARGGLTGEMALPGGRKRKKNPLWEEKGDSYHEWKRHSRPKKRRSTLVLLMVVILLSVSGWAVWEMQGMSGLEALVYWNR